MKALRKLAAAALRLVGKIGGGDGGAGLAGRFSEPSFDLRDLVEVVDQSTDRPRLALVIGRGGILARSEIVGHAALQLLELHRDGGNQPFEQTAACDRRG